MKLLIDGNYFGMRLRSAANLKFIDNPERDKVELFRMSSMILASEMKSLSKCIDGIYMCRDWSSWRKSFEQTYPLESKKSAEAQTYKENRNGDKDYDPAKFYAAFDEWCELIESKLSIPQLKTRGAEADDMIYVGTKVAQMRKSQALIWSSDGDYYHVVSPDTFLLKFPKRELFTVRRAESDTVTQKTLMSVFNQPAPGRSKLLIESFAQDTVKRINPNKSLFLKIVSGDPKDNVPTIYHWLSSTGTRTFKPSESHIIKAFAKLDIDFNNITEAQIYDTELIRLFISELLIINKQSRDIEHTLNVYCSNLKMKHLSHKQIPEDIMRACISVYNEKTAMLGSQKLSKLTDYQWILGQLGQVEDKSYFAKFDLSETINS